ncbi:ankyrin repeat-containing protein [Colletotrichum incanum]|uniref:Ankyrin repeat-containing protein n=1 Tax=Colletotrichum incanum TaxID=1573173 RepID=A0A162N4G0_COLIC|nr:ankyrin repeat-containing protein [Colletotrichum incanum]
MNGSEEEETRIPLKQLFEKRSEMHPALSEWHEPGADIWHPLWDWVFANDIFRSWQRTDYTWTLRCVGGPGSGKTTLSAVATQWLRDQYNGNKDAVASVFVREDVVTAGAAFVEDVLTSIFHQLCVSHTDEDEDEAYVAKYRLYLDARKHGHRDIFRIKLIRDALQSRLGMLDRALLVIDDFDRCSPAVDLFLENELAVLANESRLKVLITSRVSCLKDVPTEQYCDSCDNEEDAAMFLFVYWRCESCRKKKVKSAHILCQSCRDKGKTCVNCGDAAGFVQPFDHVELEVDSATQPVAHFIDWDLEMEHGDLGLGSDNPDKPPHSEFGRRLVDPRNHEALNRLRDQVKSQAVGNVSLIRLRLDNVHQTQSVGVTSGRSDVLPANIVGFFDVGIRRIEEQSPSQRSLGLKVIAAVAHYDFALGIEYENLQRILRRSTKTPARAHAKRTTSTPTVSTRLRRSTMPAPEMSDMPHRSLEEMLHAARGFLTFGNMGHRPLMAFCQSFHTYAREHYNESLVWAHAQLDFGEECLAEFGNKVMRRSRTGVAHFVEKRDQAATQRPSLQEQKGRFDGGRSDHNFDGKVGDGMADSGARGGAVPDSAAAGSASALPINGPAARGEISTPSPASMAAARWEMVKATDVERDQSFKLMRRGTSWA